MATFLTRRLRFELNEIREEVRQFSPEIFPIFLVHSHLWKTETSEKDLHKKIPSNSIGFAENYVCYHQDYQNAGFALVH